MSFDHTLGDHAQLIAHQETTIAQQAETIRELRLALSAMGEALENLATIRKAERQEAEQRRRHLIDAVGHRQAQITTLEAQLEDAEAALGIARRDAARGRTLVVRMRAAFAPIASEPDEDELIYLARLFAQATEGKY